MNILYSIYNEAALLNPILGICVIGILLLGFQSFLQTNSNSMNVKMFLLLFVSILSQTLLIR